MRLTWRDGVSTLLAAVVFLLTLAVVRDWGWPLLGSYRSGTIALALVGVVMFGLGTPAREMRWSDRFMAVEAIFGVAAFVLLIASLIAATQAWFVALAIAVMAMWFVAVLRHVVEHEPAGPAHPAVS
ncbi:MAG: hypothetical protein HYR62_05825 [Actinobacteria bacterium]|nr:hypothetical protein [Actinomycetota bacterium]MBI3687946.1 hypothetical protein [Actinomycetota bacterium]